MCCSSRCATEFTTIWESENLKEPKSNQSTLGSIVHQDFRRSDQKKAQFLGSVKGKKINKRSWTLRSICGLGDTSCCSLGEVRWPVAGSTCGPRMLPSPGGRSRPTSWSCWGSWQPWSGSSGASVAAWRASYTRAVDSSGTSMCTLFTGNSTPKHTFVFTEKLDVYNEESFNILE